METMKGLVLHSNGDFKLELVPVPRIGGNLFAPNDVLVEVEYCGICGSDIHKWLSDKSDIKNPLHKVVGGHEIVNVVREFGQNVTRFKP